MHLHNILNKKNRIGCTFNLYEVLVYLEIVQFNKIRAKHAIP